MARVVKEADERRGELLEVAMRLFVENGFERTSVEQITSAVGVAKGTFYHYFDSKQDLLAQLVCSFADALFAQLETEMSTVGGDAVERLRAFFRNASRFKLEQRDESLTIARSLYGDENVRLRHALMDGWLERTDEMLAGILAQGLAEGLFRIRDARATATIMTSLWFGWADRQAEALLDLEHHPEKAADMASAVGDVETAMERILGMKDGTLRLGLGGYVEALGKEK
jgi:AcrR family transcriptional regulator